MELMISPPDHRKLAIGRAEKLVVARETERLDLSSRPIAAAMLEGVKSARALRNAQFTNKSVSDE
jgi:hypothetical protein